MTEFNTLPIEADPITGIASGDADATLLSTVLGVVAGATRQISISKILSLLSLARFIPLDRQNTGTNALQVACFTLPAGTYTEFSAMLGTTTLTDTANLELKKQDGMSLKTLSKTGIVEQASTTGFTLPTNTVVYLVLYGNSPTTTSFVFSAGLK